MLAYLRRVIAQGTVESSRRFALVSGSLTFALAITLLSLGAMVGLAMGRDITGLAAALWPLTRQKVLHEVSHRRRGPRLFRHSLRRVPLRSTRASHLSRQRCCPL